jgi:ElaB/YqjD/DUF883 family membrane-anchored ribosome-binding protein
MENDINQTHGTVERASSGAHQAIDKVSSALQPRMEHLAEDAHQAVDRLAGAASQLKNAHARFSADRRSQIRESPMASVALSFGVGMILGWLLRSR